MLLLPSHAQGNLQSRKFHIRLATPVDIATCEMIARQYPSELAFVRRNALARGIESKSLHVAISDGYLVGFALFNSRRDGWQTIYDIAVDQRYAGLGIGRQLLYSVPAPIRLKVTSDNERANSFYRHAGMQFASTESRQGKRKLNVYEMHTLCIFCAGNNKTHPRIARDGGMAYGCAQNDTPRDWAFFADVEFEPEKQDWQDYMHKICEWRPVMAMVTDYQHVSERRRLYSQIRDLKNAGVMRVLVCPKFDGAIYHIPSWCIVALSAPTKSKKFKGWLPNWQDMTALKNRRVHVLGGTPHLQAALIDKVRLYGARVISVDGNSMQRSATRSSIWQDGQWYRKKDGAWEHGDYETTLAKSIRNIVNYINRPDEFLTAGSTSINRKRIKARQMELI